MSVLKRWNPDTSQWETAVVGKQGPQGDDGIEVSDTPPVNTTILWADTSEPGDAVVPVGGAAGESLVKLSGSDYDTGWASSGVPVGGASGQVLAKASATDYDTEWVANTVIAETTISQNTASVTFSNISTTWRRLTLTFSLRTDRNSADDYVVMSINGNTNNHARQGFEQYNGSVGNLAQGSNRNVALVHGATATSGLKGEAVVMFANSHTTDARKSWVQFYVRSAFALFNTGFVWSSLAEPNKITSITLAPSVGSNFTEGHVILTGVR